MRAERAQPKSRRDDMIIAPGKRSAAPGQRHQMNPSPFSEFGFPGLSGTPNSEKGEAGGVGGLPKAAALPWATVVLRLQGAGRANSGLIMRPPHFQPSFIPPPGGVSRGNGLGAIRITPFSFSDHCPKAMRRARSSALRIRGHPCPSVVLSCPGPATNHENCALRPTNLPSQNNSLATLLQ